MCGPASNLQTGYRFLSLTRSHGPKNVAALGKLSPNLAPVGSGRPGPRLVWVTPARRRCQGWLGAGWPQCSGRVHTEAPPRAGPGLPQCMFEPQPAAMVRTCRFGSNMPRPVRRFWSGDEAARFPTRPGPGQGIALAGLAPAQAWPPAGDPTV